jgi:hypothetical protein
MRALYLIQTTRKKIIIIALKCHQAALIFLNGIIALSQIFAPFGEQKKVSFTSSLNRFARCKERSARNKNLSYFLYRIATRATDRVIKIFFYCLRLILFITRGELFYGSVLTTLRNIRALLAFSLARFAFVSLG